MTTAPAEYRALLDAATGRPWEVSRFFWKVGSTRGMPDEWWVSVEADGSVIACAPEEAEESANNARLIVALVNDAETLVGAVEEVAAALAERDLLRAEVETLRAGAGE